MRLLLIPLFVLFSFYVIAQKSKVISVDPKTGELSEKVPYDEPFTLKIETKDEIKYVDYLKVKGGRNWYQQIKKDMGPPPKDDDKPKEFKLPNVGSGNIRTEKEEDKLYTYIHFNRDHTFDPNSDYSVILNKADTAGLNFFDKIHDGSADDKLLNSIKEKQKKKYENLEYMLPTDLKEAEKFYEDHLKKLYETIDNAESTLTTVIAGVSKNLDLEDAIKCLELDSLRKDCDVQCDDLKNLVRLDKLSYDKLKKLVKGMISMTDTIKEETDLIKQLKNLTETKESLDKVISRLQILKKSDKCSADISDLVKLFKALQGAHTQLTTITSTKKKIQSTVSGTYFAIPISISASTSIYNFQTRAKQRIIPDFGLAVYGFQKDFTKFSPYLGFHINLRSANKDIPWARYPDKTILHYTSVVVGWTLAEVKEEGKREDLFKNRSFLTGIGVKLYSHSIMFNAGALWFNRVDPNPVINNSSIRATPYVGISADLDLKDLVGGLGGFFD